MRIATWYFSTEVRRPGVSAAGIASSAALPFVVVLRLEEHDRERLLARGIVQDHELAGGKVVGPLARLDPLPLLLHVVGVDALERHDACKCHNTSLTGSRGAYALAARPPSGVPPRSGSRTAR
jgi:hypothetical protein